MAACETDGKYSDDEDSLENVFAFSQAKGQLSVCSQEGLYVKDEKGNTIDRRYQITYDAEKFCRCSYFHLGQVTVKTTRGIAVGTGYMFGNGKDEFVLSCAHNFVGYSMIDDEEVFYTNAKFYCTRLGKNYWRDKLLLSNETVRVHHLHNDNPASGFDIAVCKVTKKLGPSKISRLRKPHFCSAARLDAHFGHFDFKQIKPGLSIEIAGYPADKDKRGYPYAQTGVIKKVSKTKRGGHVIWHNVDTTPGNSGSPIFVTDKSFLQTLRICNKRKEEVDRVIVGVHTGTCVVSGMNYGTLITPELMKWMAGKKSIEEEKLELEQSSSCPLM